MQLCEKIHLDDFYVFALVIEITICCNPAIIQLMYIILSAAYKTQSIHCLSVSIEAQQWVNAI